MRKSKRHIDHHVASACSVALSSDGGYPAVGTGKVPLSVDRAAGQAFAMSWAVCLLRFSCLCLFSSPDEGYPHPVPMGGVPHPVMMVVVPPIQCRQMGVPYPVPMGRVPRVPSVSWMGSPNLTDEDIPHWPDGGAPHWLDEGTPVSLMRVSPVGQMGVHPPISQMGVPSIDQMG